MRPRANAAPRPVDLLVARRFILLSGTKEKWRADSSGTRAAAPENVRQPGTGLKAKMDGLSVKAWIGIGIAIAAVVLGSGAFYT